MGVSVTRSAKNVEARFVPDVEAQISTEAAITLFGIGMGVATAVAQLYAARRLNRGGFDNLQIASLGPAMIVALLGLMIAASMVPGPDE